MAQGRGRDTPGRGDGLWEAQQARRSSQREEREGQPGWRDQKRQPRKSTELRSYGRGQAEEHLCSSQRPRKPLRAFKHGSDVRFGFREEL